MPGTNNRGTLPCRRHEPGVRFTDRARNARARNDPEAASPRAGVHAIPRLKGGRRNAGPEGQRDRHDPHPRRRRRGRPAHARNTRPDRPRTGGNTSATDLSDRGRGGHGARGREREEPQRHRDLVQRAAHERAGRRGSRGLPVAPTLALPVGQRQRAHPNRHLHHEPAVPADAQRRPGDPNDPTRRRGNEREPVLSILRNRMAEPSSRRTDHRDHAPELPERQHLRGVPPTSRGRRRHRLHPHLPEPPNPSTGSRT